MTLTRALIMSHLCFWLLAKSFIIAP
jgi:hypothetical protein